MKARIKICERPGAACAPALMALVATLLVGGLPARATVTLWDQTSNYANAISSQFDPGASASIATAYDNFTLGSSATITEVSWQGSYYNPATPGTITGFDLEIRLDAAGQPGGAQMISLFGGNASESFVGMDNAGDPTYSYDYVLPLSYSVTGGTQYWLSIVPSLPFPPQWGWETATGGDGISYQDFGGSRGVQPHDLAFTLKGDLGTAAPVPEPATAGLLGLGLATSGFMAWRRRRS